MTQKKILKLFLYKRQTFTKTQIRKKIEEIRYMILIFNKKEHNSIL